MRHITLSLVMLLSSCAAPPQFYKEGGTQEQFTKDQYDCEKDARERTVAAGSPNNPLLMPDYYQDCMQRKHGYKIVKQ